MRDLIGTGIQAGATYLAGPAGGMIVDGKFLSYKYNPALQSRGGQLLGNIGGYLSSGYDSIFGKSPSSSSAKPDVPNVSSTASYSGGNNLFANPTGYLSGLFKGSK
jgi:hypothetical protein